LHAAIRSAQKTPRHAPGGFTAAPQVAHGYAASSCPRGWGGSGCEGDDEHGGRKRARQRCCSYDGRRFSVTARRADLSGPRTHGPKSTLAPKAAHLHTVGRRAMRWKRGTRKGRHSGRGVEATTCRMAKPFAVHVGGGAKAARRVGSRRAAGWNGSRHAERWNSSRMSEQGAASTIGELHCGVRAAPRRPIWKRVPPTRRAQGGLAWRHTAPRACTHALTPRWPPKSRAASRP